MSKVKKCPDGFDIHVSDDEAITLSAVFSKVGGYGDPLFGGSKNKPTRRKHTQGIFDQLRNLGIDYADKVTELSGQQGLQFSVPLE